MRLDSYKYIYLIGIGGIGMSALARYFNAKGQIVFGYDRIRSELCVELENEKIQIRYKDEVSSIPDQIKDASNKDILVIYTPAIPSNNYIFSFFNNKGFKIFKRAEILGFISKRSFTIAVAGTHGKTTTSTILAHLLQQAGKNVTAFLGGISRNYNTNILLTDKSDILIIEADEYDKSFLHIHADIAIITSVDIDHLDTYKDKWDLHLGFKQFASQVKQKGLLLVEESIAIDFDKPYLGEKRTYSIKKKADYFAENIGIVNGRMLFDVIVPEKTKKDIEFQMPGLHNVNNSIAALAVSYYLGLSLNEISKGLATFKGIGRRYEKHINTKELVYIDDYAHHPVEVSKTIDTTRKLYPSRELIVVFQPHLFSRTKDLAKDFAISLEAADHLVLLEIYPAREKPITGVNSQMLLKLCNNSKKEVCSKENLLYVLKKNNIDVLLTLGAGDIDTLVEPIKHMLN